MTFEVLLWLYFKVKCNYSVLTQTTKHFTVVFKMSLKFTCHTYLYISGAQYSQDLTFG